MISREAVEAAGADGVVGTLRSALDSLEPTAPWTRFEIRPWATRPQLPQPLLLALAHGLTGGVQIRR